MLLRTLAGVRQPLRSRATACMADSVIDLTSPPSAPRRQRRRTSVVDLTSSPEPVVLSDSEFEELPAVPKRGRPRKTSPAAPPVPVPGVSAATGLPPRLLAGRGFAAALKHRGALPVGKAGEPLCRWCQQPVPPPKKTFCSPGCVHEHMLRSNTGYARQQTFARDGGACASCGLAAHLLYLGAAAAPPGSGLPPARRSARRWASTAALKAALRASVGPTWRASVAGRAKPLATLLHDAAVAAAAHAAGHTWPPAVAAALAAGDVDGGAPAALRALAGMEESESEADVSDDGLGRGELDEEQRRLGTELAAWLKGNGFHSVTAGGRSALRAGDFWAMDHILPVAEGGGSCGLENLRTLCTPCHALATRRLAARLALQRRGASAADVELLAPPLVAAAPPPAAPVTEYPGSRKRAGRRKARR